MQLSPLSDLCTSTSNEIGKHFVSVLHDTMMGFMGLGHITHSRTSWKNTSVLDWHIHTCDLKGTYSAHFQVHTYSLGV